MSTTLYVNASLGGDASHSKRLAQEFLSAWRDRHPDSRVLSRDRVQNPPPLIDEADTRAAQMATYRAQLLAVVDRWSQEQAAAADVATGR